LDRATVEVYERVARAYAAARTPRRKADAVAFGTRVPAGAWRADLGCGHGRYTPHLGAPVLALDAADAMLALVGDGLRVRADLEALPLRRGALAGAWANFSYQHIRRGRLPLALARLHDALQVGAPVWISFAAPGTDDFPGRLFEPWTADDLSLVFEGAGFGVDEQSWDGEDNVVQATRLRTLPEIVGPGMRLLVCGLNPSVYSADRGIAFARPGNRFWPAALLAGLVSRDRDPWHALHAHGVGFTDLVKRASARADALGADEYRAGVERVTRLVETLRPAVVCMVGLTGWRSVVDRHAVAGVQAGGLAGAPVYVMPNPSGVNAHTTVADLAAHFEAAVLTGSRG
jgi:TDG/mug DNA glycosylase family protein